MVTHLAWRSSFPLNVSVNWPPRWEVCVCHVGDSLLGLTQGSFSLSGASAQLHISIYIYRTVNVHICTFYMYIHELWNGATQGLCSHIFSWVTLWGCYIMEGRDNTERETAWREMSRRPNTTSVSENKSSWLVLTSSGVWGATVELYVEESTAGRHHGASTRENTERPHHPYLCFSWLCKHHFFLTSTAAKNNHAKLMAYTHIKLLKLHWSLQHGMPKGLLIAHLKLMSSRFLFGSWSWIGNPDCGGVCFFLEQWFLGGGSATIQRR